MRPKTGNVVGSVVSNQWLILCRLPSLYSLQPQKVRPVSYTHLTLPTIYSV